MEPIAARQQLAEAREKLAYFCKVGQIMSTGLVLISLIKVVQEVSDVFWKTQNCWLEESTNMIKNNFCIYRGFHAIDQLIQQQFSWIFFGIIGMSASLAFREMERIGLVSTESNPQN